jgi:dipeptidyl-peptidase-4
MPREHYSAMRRRITVEDIARVPAPGMNAPSAIQFSPDGKTLTYLWSAQQTLVQELWAYDLATGREWVLLEATEESTPAETDFSCAEAMRRERLRQYTLGVTDYAWGQGGRVLMARRQGEVLVRAGEDGAWRALPESHTWIDPQISPNERWIGFAYDGELFVLDLTDVDATPRQLTFDAAPADVYGDRDVINGIAEYAAQEDFGRLSGFWWSPDSKRIVFEQADLSAVPRYLITHSGTALPEFESHRYPYAGQPNAAVRLGVIAVAGGEPLWLSLGDDRDVYLVRVAWTPDGCVVAQVLSRDQQTLSYWRCDPASGTGTVLFEDRVAPWVNVNDDLRFVQAAGAAAEDYRILWSSERSGWRELYLCDREGRLSQQLSNHDAFIDGVCTVDATSGWIYIHGWRESPLQRHLFRVSLAGGPLEQLTRTPGTHRCTVAPDCRTFVDCFDAAGTPPVATLRALNGDELARLQAKAMPDPRLRELALVPPEFVEVAAEDGTILHGALYRPRGLAPGVKAPVIVNVYGGPGFQRVVDGWTMTADLRPQALAEAGHFVFALDNRGMARRGLAFEAALNRRLGVVEVRDQVAGVHWLAEHVPEADTERVGIYGWSYGGYLSLLCLACEPAIFKAAAACAFGSDWEEYDSGYTERYLGLPRDNPEGYREGSVLTHAANIRGALLLVHGLIDENVHFRNMGRLIHEVLIPNGIDHETVIFPEQRHHLRREGDRVWLERAVIGFFKRSL